ncbi:unnamed protein product [Schistocephalus solidus]|uniref:4.1m domain-containing protein n=1 Tax=Schistocephalus solidus TaxID=70667 RepID=A0A183T611_SCHSO|nr:unnamed protein product [Schistocephalus solidus]
MSGNVIVLSPHTSYISAYSNFFAEGNSAQLSVAAITGIVFGVLAAVLLIIAILLIAYCCCRRNSGYQSAYDTEEALGNANVKSADYALRQKANGHPDVKPELFI